jgi:hypothetical protein
MARTVEDLKAQVARLEAAVDVKVVGAAAVCETARAADLDAIGEALDAFEAKLGADAEKPVPPPWVTQP